MLETAERLTPRRRSRRCSSSCCWSAALRTLADGEHEPGLVLDAFFLRSLAVAGYAPALDAMRPVRGPGPHRAFAIAAGGVVCGDLPAAGSVVPAPRTTIGLMSALLQR